MRRKSAHKNVPKRTNSNGADESSGNSGSIRHQVHDRYVEYVYVTPDDLRETREINALQEVLFGVGTFFFSGAFWLLLHLLAHQDRFAITAWMAACALSMLFGLTLAIVGLRLQWMRQDRLKKYFPVKGTNGASRRTSHLPLASKLKSIREELKRGRPPKPRPLRNGNGKAARTGGLKIRGNGVNARTKKRPRVETHPTATKAGRVRGRRQLRFTDPGDG
jgi:hypothetical protein